MPAASSPTSVDVSSTVDAEAQNLDVNLEEGISERPVTIRRCDVESKVG